MATVLGVNTTAIQAGGLANKLLSGLVDARVKVSLDSYVLAGTEASGTLLEFFIDANGNGLLPSGANVVAILLQVSAAQTALTASVGDGNSATRYASAATSLQTAGTYIIGGKEYVLGTNAGTVNTANGDRFIKITTGGATATAGTLYIVVVYTLD